jgi:hypothetical protein
VSGRPRRRFAGIGRFLLALATARAALADGKELPIPGGPEPAPVAIPHFPGRLEAYVFRNWGVAPAERIALAIDASADDVRRLARDLGLGDPPRIDEAAWRRSPLTVIRRNWHLLPYPQLLALLGWSEGQLGYALREDDFLWIKLGSLKPRCVSLRFEEPDAAARERQAVIRKLVAAELGEGGLAACRPRFSFLEDLLAPEAAPARPAAADLEPGWIDLASGWRLELEADAGPVLRAAAERFRGRLAQAFGAELALTAGGTGRSITVRIRSADFPGPEAHALEIGSDRVRITAGGEEGALRAFDGLLDRMEELGAPRLREGTARRRPRFAVRFLHSYFALYGDALLEPGLDPYPDGYLARLSRLGVNGVWLPVLLRNLAPAAEALGFPADAAAAREREARLQALGELVERARRHGIGIYLYLNEPRALPLAAFAGRDELKGVTEGDAATLCTSVEAVRAWLRDSVAQVLGRVPGVAGLFTITASENLSSCWSHHRGKDCPRCRDRAPAEVIAEVNRLVAEGARAAASKARIIAWDWGWRDDWIEPAITALPAGTAVMSVSEWSLPIARGGVATTVGEYSLSAVGPGPRARRTWKLARARGLETIAKVQAGCTWELSAAPYIPAVKLAAEHARGLAAADVDGVMLGWTLGGYPSPNLEAFARYAFFEEGGALPAVDVVLTGIARRRLGPSLAVPVAAAWSRMSDAFREYPYDGLVVYRAPLQHGPANLLHVEPTGYTSTMIGFPYDDLDGWRGPYPRETFAAQLETVVRGWEEGLRLLGDGGGAGVRAERDVAEACLLHFRSAAAQARFVIARDRHREARARGDRAAAGAALDALETIAREEEATARRLLALAREDTRIGFEASNQYYYVPADLLEKMVSCRWIVEEWVPRERGRE